MTTDRAVMEEARAALISGDRLAKRKSLAALRQALAQPVPDVAEQGQDALDAKRYRQVLLIVGAGTDHYGSRCFTLNNLKAVVGANILKGSVSQHFDDALDAAMGTQPTRLKRNAADFEGPEQFDREF